MTRIFSFKLYYYFTYLILGIVMLGAFMPIGIKTVGSLSGFEKQFIAWAWAWAINGFFSVVASVLATILI